MNFKCLSLAAVLTASAPAFAISINMTDFSRGSPATVSFSDSATGVTYHGVAGQFVGTMSNASSPSATTSLSVASNFATQDVSTSFTAYCAEITQTFNFNVTYQYTPEAGTAYFGLQKETDLSRLFTATAGFVVNSATSAAVQAAIWEIIYEPGTHNDLNSGDVVITAADSDDVAAFAAVNVYLANLSSYAPLYNVEVLTNPQHQDFVIDSIPEPGTWAMLVAGLGALGLMTRRRKR